MEGLAGNVFQLSVYVPDPAKLFAGNPNFLNYRYPPQSNVRVVIGAVVPVSVNFSEMISQDGIVLNVR